jgi:hypothetical protein
MNLLEKYKPRSLGELLGQPWVSHQLQFFAERPYPCAFLFEGDTGTGKTSAALLLAEALGVKFSEGPFAGLHQIASGEQTGETVRKTMDGLRCRPFFGSGWRVLVVNEADAMTPNAAYIWLDALEDIPPQTVVIFTTNAPGKIPARLRDRCKRLAFESSALLLRPCLQELIDRVWREEGCPGAPPEVEALGVADENGSASFRRLVQKLAPYVRAGIAPVAPVAAIVPEPTVAVAVSADAVSVASQPAAFAPENRLHVLGQRWASGEAITRLAREANCSWNRLWTDLTKLGYKQGA